MTIKRTKQSPPYSLALLRISIITAVFLLALTSCVPQDSSLSNTENVSITRGEINGVQYFIPKDYFVPPFGEISDDTIYIRALYPDFSPIKVSMQTLFDQKQQHRKIDILAKYVPNAKPPHEYAESVIDKTWKAYKIVGEEYDLIHQTQPEGYNQDNHDMWLEKKDGKYTSFINCSKKLSKISVPHCFDHVFQNGFHIQITYNKLLLPKWKTVRQQSLGLLKTFESKDAAEGLTKQ